MAIKGVAEKYIPKDNSFYRDRYHYFFYAMMALIALLLLVASMVMYQMTHRPKPTFAALQPDGKTMPLMSYDTPNLLPDTIIRFASKAAVTAYTFDFVNYNTQIPEVRRFFTDGGWSDFVASAQGLVTTIVKKQLIVSGVVSGTPVISDEEDVPGKGHLWRVQIPFLVTYLSPNTAIKRYYTLTLVIVSVPTSVNPQGIGIDQFMTG